MSYKGTHLTIETKNKISNSLKGSHKSDDVKKSISLLRKGKTYEEMYGKEKATELRKQRKVKLIERHASGNMQHLYETIKKSNSNRIISLDTRKKINIKKIGKTYEEIYGESKAKIIKTKISNGNIGKIISKEAIEKQRLLMIGKKHSVETRQKIKEKRALQITPKFDTSIEIKIQNFLKQLNIEYFTHQYINIEHAYQCDILVPSINLVIECDGDYWHKYPLGLEKDHIRTSELIEKGFKVLRLWGSEIKGMNIDKFKNKLEMIRRYSK